ncbi:MAG: transketolase [Epulopiscium sp.]|jgi:transketolase|uniref:Transketolase n=1 Tax=Defluviitalea raffinosedens TaxID=1450156 RepID=A0A7C8LT37_9FIRM|nr:transketolase [Defluviitalea raffinosedens]MBZ4668364.1 transketolase [Defluviitaleaceae bacterium]MDK2789275.1 transketolase [Candidatus Epulonipiscium sp.]KAE9634007.1 transketolase [Defluviitalea raffinosedens]MBM7685864.1 transketolase [Defluviitalea raffinosedens]HHW67948.1 transketolase [Candidatus Epulonipiscium sp.]
MTKERKEELQKICLRFRNELIDLLYSIQTGHPGGSLSCTEIVTTLFFEKMNIDPKNPNKEGRDRFIMSKGHAAPMLYLNMAEKGYFPREDLKTLRQVGSHLQGHPCAHTTPGVELSTGPLGMGLGAGLGMALGEKLKNSDATIYVLLGDGEIQEGGIWEAAMAASKFKANNLIAILDYNGVQLDGTLEEIMPMGDIGKKFESFGWNVLYCDGHDVEDIANAIDEAKNCSTQPSIIIAKTVKGKGISFMEGKNSWHGKPIDLEEYKLAKAELGGVV